jgi:hypothetical protein
MLFIISLLKQFWEEFILGLTDIEEKKNAGGSSLQESLSIDAIFHLR